MRGLGYGGGVMMTAACWFLVQPLAMKLGPVLQAARPRARL
jgi:hypothetical protein